MILGFDVFAAFVLHDEISFVAYLMFLIYDE
jgi:hypothetical protein